MYPSYHAGFGAIFAAILYILFPGIGLIGACLIFLSSFLADFDHYLIYVKRKKDLSIKRAYGYFVKMSKDLYDRKLKRAPLLFLHTIEFAALLVIFSFAVHWLFYIALGLLFHMLMDFIELKKHNRLDIKGFSIVEDYFLKRK
ncbi:hypothetical protein JXB27_02035 [Candidatus Woesearchaeota archaeon]|nr:hypothetical protein [Candidatus Woesearchaeota archaeon]